MPPEAYDVFSILAPLLELLWSDMLSHWQMHWSGLQVLPKCQNIYTLHCMHGSRKCQQTGRQAGKQAGLQAGRPKTRA